MSDFFGKLKSGAGKVAFEADKMTRLSKAQSEVNQVKKQIDADFTKLGEMYYRQYFNPVSGSAAVTTGTQAAFNELCQHVAQLEQQLTWKNEEVQRISAEMYNPQGSAQAQPAQTAQPAPQPVPQAPAPVVTPPPPIETFTVTEATTQIPVEPEAAAPATRFCPSCGKEQPVTVKFCTECGARLM